MPRILLNLALLLAWASPWMAHGQSFAPAMGVESQPAARAALAAQNWPSTQFGPADKPGAGVVAGVAGTAEGGMVQPASFTTPVAAASQEIPLPPPSRRVDSSARAASAPTPSGRGEPKPGVLPSLFTLGTSLAVVLGLFLTAAWLLRKTGVVSTALLPKEVLEVLGRAPLAGRQQVHLLRCGRKLLLVAVSAAGMETLSEITDPLEVDRLAGLCQQSRTDSASTVFRQVFQQFAQPPHSRRKSNRSSAAEMELADAGGIDMRGELQEPSHG